MKERRGRRGRRKEEESMRDDNVLFTKKQPSSSKKHGLFFLWVSPAGRCVFRVERRARLCAQVKCSERLGSRDQGWARAEGGRAKYTQSHRSMGKVRASSRSNPSTTSVMVCLVGRTVQSIAILGVFAVLGSVHEKDLGCSSATRSKVVGRRDVSSAPRSTPLLS